LVCPKFVRYGKPADFFRITDELIDQIVYRLYGLTAEEIAIVESKP
jgi:hypothetical protein